MSKRAKQYKATAVRAGQWWAVKVALPGAIVHTQGRDLDDAEFMARDAVASALGVDVAGVAVELTVDAGVNDLTSAAVLAAARREEAVKAADNAMRAAALALAGRGIKMRDAGRILGVSHQRVSQILAKGAQ